MRQWYDYQGNTVTLTDDAPLTMYDGLNHQIIEWPDDTVAQMVTKCGKRACPTPRSGLREVPGRGFVDCPACLADIGAEILAKAFRGFIKQEGATERPNDFADCALMYLTDAGYTVTAIRDEAE